MSDIESLKERLANGQFAPSHCGDPNCSGDLVRDVERHPWGNEPVLRCDGLTYREDEGPLIACDIALPALPAKQGE